ncbi:MULTISPECIES: flavin reductase family protein [unclassified Gordonia (in: high G+C Gram-positive bacteria)]|uniref:flavin reductase family protein n=1 Tax=unclassified Gordonia (in: high G+C Gram-positive bacteria) TaxID=2657482 RepID=UPI001FFF79AF|nr:flavin reductase family protein [Gordonia sp. PP30]UQE76691.1 flavin reductase family protein [Gordonia sp. PP30]
MSAPARSRSRAALDPASLRRLFGHIPSGLVAVAALGTEGPLGVLVATFAPVSLDPPLVSVAIARSSTTLPALRDSSHWGLSVLGEHQRHVADGFRRPADQRFSDLDWSATSDGAIHLDGAAATLTVCPVEFVPAGDHVIALAALTDHAAGPTSDPLIFHHSRFHRLDKETHR